jgi:general secretion pathway protein L
MKPALHLLHLPADPEAPARELFVDARGLALAKMPVPGTPVQRVLAVPSQALVLRRVAAGAASAAQARAAAWHALENHLAAPRESLAWVVADEAADGSRWVAGFAPQARRAWLEAATARGFTPDRIVPDCLLLPAPTESDAVVVVETPSGIHLARAGKHAFAAEASLAEHLLTGRRIERPADDDIDSLLLRGAFEAALPDLSPQTASAKGPVTTVPRRRLLALAGALVLSPLLVWTAQALRHDLAAARLDAAADASLRTLAPDATGPGPALSRARAALAQRQAPDRFGQLVAALLDAQAQVPGSRLQQIELQPDGVLEVRWQHGPGGLPANLAQTLADHGVALAEAGTDNGGAQAVTTLLLSELP